jgi:hypothetical protein
MAGLCLRGLLTSGGCVDVVPHSKNRGGTKVFQHFDRNKIHIEIHKFHQSRLGFQGQFGLAAFSRAVSNF